MTQHINLDEYAARGTVGSIDLAPAFMEAAIRAHLDRATTYLASGGEVFAAITPPEAAERYEHAAEARATHEATVPALVRTEPRRRRRRRPWFTWGPFEGIF